MNYETFWLLPLLFVVGSAAGWIDSIAGGGGLITVPVLLSIGLPPAEALGTNKLQAVFGSSSATWHYGRAGLINFRAAIFGVVFTALGAVSGALAVQHIRPDFLRTIIPFLLIAIAVFFLFRPQLGDIDVRPHLSAGLFHFVFGLALGFYDGFFGPGTGTFWAMAYVLLLGFNLTKATAHTKLMNFTSNAASLAMFVIGGQAHLLVGLTMGAGQLVGARIGAKMVIRRGARFIRPIFIAVAIAMSARLLWQNFAQR
ncbi:MAG TPA: TSUP family transporter [Verrucomicrobiae bacterium]|nr:TSUP family transporter [Verrucomicrobiae bacterium]